MKTTRTMQTVVMMLAALALLAGMAQAGVVAVTGVTGHDGGNWPNYYGHLSDMVNGSDPTIIDTGTGGDLTNPGMTVVTPDDPSDWTYSGGSWHQEWKANSRLTGASNGKIGWAALDLGSSVANLDKMYLWNVRFQNNTENVATYNVWTADSPTAALPAMPKSKQVTGDYDFNSGGWTLLNTGGPLSLAQNTSNNSTPQGEVDLGGVSAQYVGIEILTAGGTANRVGLAQVEVTATASSGPAPLPTTRQWTFDEPAGPDEQGWKDVLTSSAANANTDFDAFGSGWGRSPQGGVGWLAPSTGDASGWNQRDGNNDTFAIRSPKFVLGTGEISFFVQGGAPGGSAPGNFDDLGGTGFLGMALRDDATGDYVLAKGRPSNGDGYLEVIFTEAELAAHVGGVFTLDYIDDKQGGWGWGGVDTVTVAIEAPEPATMALLSLAACGLGGYVRKRRKA